MVDLDDRIALITGAAGGIGSAIADELAGRGAYVVVADLDETKAASVATQLAEAHDGRAMGVGIDVARSDSVRAAVELVERELSRIDILVNNAGIDRVGPFVESTEEAWDLLLAVNLKGTMLCTRAVLDGMLDRGRGRIINIASDAGKVGAAGEVVYSATKGGIIAFAKALAREVARAGITVNVVCPGPTDTALLGQVAEASQRLYDSLVKAIPVRRIAQPADIAPMVAFLASDGASYITGQAISVSGGLTMS